MDNRRGTVRIVIADDHPTFREGLMRLLETQEGLHVVGAAADGEEALRLVDELKPDLLLLDRTMPRMDGLVALRELRQRNLSVQIMLVTAAIERADIATALQLGAQGVVLKESASEILFKGIRAVMAGHLWVGRARVTDLAATLRDLAVPHTVGARKHFGLTPRELEIVSVILSGYSNNAIAAKYSLSEKTVKHHLTNIFDKLGVSNRLELALFALHHNLVAPAAAAEAAQPAGVSAA
jgi:two-component system nitrate/nitrite response regulator NarL